MPGMSRDAPGTVRKKGGKFKFDTVECDGVMGMARIGFWRGGDGVTSVLAWRKGQNRILACRGRVETPQAMYAKRAGNSNLIWHNHRVPFLRWH